MEYGRSYLVNMEEVIFSMLKFTVAGTKFVSFFLSSSYLTHLNDIMTIIAKVKEIVTGIPEPD